MAKSEYNIAQSSQYGTFLNEVGRGVDPAVAARLLHSFSDAEKKKIVDATDGGVVPPATRFEV